MAVLQAQTALCSRGRRPFLPLTSAAGVMGAAASTRPLQHRMGRQQLHSHHRQMIRGQQRARILTARFSAGDEALVLSRNPYYREIPLGRGLHGWSQPAPEDFYSLLSLDLDESPSSDEIKAAYRRLNKTVHPDLVGSGANALAVLLNACYSVLMDETLRSIYDRELRLFRKGVGSFDGRPVSRWSPNAQQGETRAVFVAENECIGCKSCTQIAPSTFFIEDEHGRARVGDQWADDEESIKDAVQSCPVDCIYYVQKDQLPLLEFVMKSCKRENPGLMGRRRSGNMGPPMTCECPFERAVVYVKQRKNVQVEEALHAAGVQSGRALHDERLATAIAGAWLELPHEVRAKAWPEWAERPMIIL